MFDRLGRRILDRLWRKDSQEVGFEQKSCFNRRRYGRVLMGDVSAFEVACGWQADEVFVDVIGRRGSEIFSSLTDGMFGLTVWCVHLRAVRW